MDIVGTLDTPSTKCMLLQTKNPESSPAQCTKIMCIRSHFPIKKYIETSILKIPFVVHIYGGHVLLATCITSRESKYTASQSGYFDYKYSAVIKN